MENKLKNLFDYQRFEQNDKLEKLIQETESRYAKGLSDDDLFLVNAAGEPETGQTRGIDIPQKEKQIGGLIGCCAGGTVTGYNIGALTGDFIGNYADDSDSK